MCHTDWEYLFETGKGMKFRPFPLVLGHEAAGIVESTGPEVTRFSPGKVCHKQSDDICLISLFFSSQTYIIVLLFSQGTKLFLFFCHTVGNVNAV